MKSLKLSRSNEEVQRRSHLLNTCPFQVCGFASANAPALTLSVSDGMLSCMAAAANTSYALHERTNGSTVSLIHGNMAGLKLFSVSIYPSRSITLWERPGLETLLEYTKANLDLLLRTHHALGTWCNDYDCVHCLDTVVLVRDRDTAIELGLRFNQLAIFDLEAHREISIRRATQESAAELEVVGND